MIDLVSSFVLPAAMRVLGERYDSPEARAMLLAIGLQESRFQHRAQVRGPARGFWQFERGGGVEGVLLHPQTSARALETLTTLRYHRVGESLAETTGRVHAVLEHNDILAAAFARLLLWTLPTRLPRRDQPGIGWYQYVDAWRPGKPHRATWDAFFAEAWDRVEIDLVTHDGPRSDSSGPQRDQ